MEESRGDTGGKVEWFRRWSKGKKGKKGQRRASLRFQLVPGRQKRWDRSVWFPVVEANAEEGTHDQTTSLGTVVAFSSPIRADPGEGAILDPSLSPSHKALQYTATVRM